MLLGGKYRLLFLILTELNVTITIVIFLSENQQTVAELPWVLERKARKKTNETLVAIARKELEIRERKKKEKTEYIMTTKKGMEWTN